MFLATYRSRALLIVLAAMAIFLVTPSIFAQVQVEYGKPANQKCTDDPLVEKIENVAVRTIGRWQSMLPERDARLRRALRQLTNRRWGASPPYELLQAALWQQGIIEPPPHLILVEGISPGQLQTSEGTKILESELLGTAGHSRYRRLAAATITTGPACTADQENACVVQAMIALLESYVTIDPIAQSLPAGGSLTLKGRILPPFQKPRSYMILPAGTVAPLPLEASGPTFQGQFVCEQTGRYQIEINGENRFGNTVLANFPIYCGVTPPSVLANIEDKSTALRGQIRKSEDYILRQINSDRQKAGLSPLTLSARLSDVARSHSVDMQRNGFVGHVSPTTGNAIDRLRKAKVAADLVLENVARTYSPEDAHSGFMASPGHRANVLNPRATEVGIGVVWDSSKNEIWVSELFSKPPVPLAGVTANEVFALLLQKRQALLKRSELKFNEALSEVANDLVKQAARPPSSSEKIQEILNDFKPNFSGQIERAQVVLVVSSEPAELVERADILRSLSDPAINQVGVGAIAAPWGDRAESLFCVLIFGQSRK